jgi:hypothetical protein
MRKLSGERNLSKSKASRREKLPVSASFDAAESGSTGESLDDVARKEIAKRLCEERVSPDFIYAFERTGDLVTDGNRDLWTAKALREWTRAFGEYRRRVEGDSKAIDLCFAMHHETGRTDPAKKKRPRHPNSRSLCSARAIESVTKLFDWTEIVAGTTSELSTIRVRYYSAARHTAEAHSVSMPNGASPNCL